MGSVAILTTSGDNDPELEPVQSYRHYLYCDACGSFEFERWETVDAAVEQRHRWLGLIALWATPFLVVPAWEAAGLAASLSTLLYVAIGFAMALLVWWVIVLPGKGRFAAIGLVLTRGLPWLLALVVAEELCAALPGGAVAGVASMLVAGALAWRAALPPGRQSLGLRCRNCEATYGHRTAFFENLDDNPRGLTASDVPRPLGRTEFREGRYVGPAPTPDSGRLP